MKLHRLVAAAAAVFALAACSSDGATENTTSSAATTSVAENSPAPSNLPTAEELNAVLATAADPNIPVEQKVTTVQGGETAPELFDVMTQAKIDSGAEFQVVPPILPGYTPDSVLATVNVTLPDSEPSPAENVEFVFEDGTWKLSQSWACTLIENTVTPEQVPAMCQG
ncbi:putative secreted protein [Corynebacterium kutscheri]|uniref:Secreted protein n=1 Tax=Corynebacterium kutscheri TaxID=35755 RepID=A0A0F6R066_9CORY|nr:hypothetical protein UL82_06910 [Corynebacterium kutscheri]VEH08826.1 putative secreted protein [Corynebacterium kutscheri]VEH09871.1 putative secreted protein [Corynebacterium kutscheri]VEH79955.1 putative secreted protein [Corynebacterium kutscheri]